MLLRREANYLCALTGVDRPADGALQTLFTEDIPQPIILQKPGVTVWIDRYYAAYETVETGLVYDYLTEYHVREEKETWGRLPEEVEKAFRRHEERRREKTPDSRGGTGSRRRERNVYPSHAPMSIRWVNGSLPRV